MLTSEKKNDITKLKNNALTYTFLEIHFYFFQEKLTSKACRWIFIFIWHNHFHGLLHIFSHNLNHVLHKFNVLWVWAPITFTMWSPADLTNWIVESSTFLGKEMSIFYAESTHKKGSGCAIYIELKLRVLPNKWKTQSNILIKWILCYISQDKAHKCPKFCVCQFDTEVFGLKNTSNIYYLAHSWVVNLSAPLCIYILGSKDFHSFSLSPNSSTRKYRINFFILYDIYPISHIINN